MARLTLRIEFGGEDAVGPGKIRLLELIDSSGSISAAGREMGMSYRRAWLLIDEVNRCFRRPVVEKRAGGSRGGGAALTPFGQSLVKHYRAVEVKAAAAAAPHLRALHGELLVGADAARRRRAG
ncbi:MAG: LysR family transcriptional regulator [Rhodospirillales bacterium]|nr:MAG: LysR family transcriptional regulator [Rhodospirillales bacterium]